MKKVLLGLITVVILTLGSNVGLAAPQNGLPDSSIGVIDVTRIMAESPKVKALQAELDQVGRGYAAQIEAEKPNLSPEELDKKQAIAYQQFLAKKRELESQIDDTLRQVLEEVAKARKLSIILYKNSVAFGGTDITTEVISRMR